MEFRMLGLLEVVRDGKPVPVKGRHQPRLLAMLLLDAGRAVDMSRLVEALWEDDPPETARRQVQNYIAALRRGLGTVPIDAAGDGYRLDVDRATVDGLRFDELTARARADVERSRYAEALAGFNRALALWRGAPLSGLSSRPIAVGAARWEEKRLTAEEERAVCKLALGRHGDLTVELVETVARQPFRQRPAELLMLALYRSGRAGEAVRVYDELRRRLADELGIDPDPAVRELCDRILREDPDLAEPRPGTDTMIPAPATVVPAQLPRDISTFTGRGSQLATLDRLLDEPNRVAVLSALTGGGGVGKTALAVHWGRKRRDRFPDGQVFVNLRGFDLGEPVTPQQALPRLLRALGVPAADVPSDLENAAALFRSLVAEKRILVVLDNATSAEHVRPLLPAGGRALVVVTSRNRMDDLAASHDVTRISVDRMTQSEAVELLTDLVGAERLHAEPEATHRLARLCGHLPLALRIAGANLNVSPDTTIAGFADELEANRLDALTVAGDPQADIAVTFDRSFGSLDAAARQLLLRVSLIPGTDFTDELVAEVRDVAEGDPKLILDRLESAHLVEQYRQGRYRLHDLVRAYALRRADDQLDESVRDEVRNQCIDWYCALNTGTGNEELINTIAAFEAWRSTDNGWRLAIALGNYVHYGYPMHEISRLVEPELERVAALNDMDSRSQMFNAVAKLRRETGDFDAAVEFGRKAVSAIAGTERGDFDGKYQGNLALFLLEAGKTREAEEFARSGLSAARESSNQAHVEICSAILAATYREMGEYRVAIDLLYDLLDDFGGSFDSPRGLMTRLQFAHVYLDMGRHQEAAKQLAAFDESYRQGGSTRADIGLLQLRGELALGTRRYTEAHTHITETLAIATQTRRLGSIRAMEIALAELFLGLDELETALDHLARAGSTRHSPVAVRYRADCLRVETAIRLHQGDHVRARETGEQALALFAEMPRWHRYARTLLLVAEALDGLGHHSQADDHRDEALTIFTRLEVPEARSL